MTAPDAPPPLNHHQLTEVPVTLGIQILFDTKLIELRDFVKDNPKRLTTEEGATRFAMQVLVLQALFNAAEHAHSTDPDHDLPIPEMRMVMDSLVDLLSDIGRQFLDVDALFEEAVRKHQEN